MLYIYIYITCRFHPEFLLAVTVVDLFVDVVCDLCCRRSFLLFVCWFYFLFNHVLHRSWAFNNELSLFLSCPWSICCFSREGDAWFKFHTSLPPLKDDYFFDFFFFFFFFLSRLISPSMASVSKSSRSCKCGFVGRNKCKNLYGPAGGWGQNRVFVGSLTYLDWTAVNGKNILFIRRRQKSIHKTN